MEIIALRGDSLKGKSKTLNIVYQYLLLFGYIQVSGHFKGFGKDLNDFIDIVEKKGVKVGIVTMGDYEKTRSKNPKFSVQNLVDHLKSQGCEKIICAVNTSLKYAITYIGTHSHIFIDKTITSLNSEERIKNGEDAERIYKLV